MPKTTLSLHLLHTLLHTFERGVTIPPVPALCSMFAATDGAGRRSRLQPESCRTDTATTGACYSNGTKLGERSDDFAQRCGLHCLCFQASRSSLTRLCIIAFAFYSRRLATALREFLRAADCEVSIVKVERRTRQGAERGAAVRARP